MNNKKKIIMDNNLSNHSIFSDQPASNPRPEKENKTVGENDSLQL